jgi:hypothetical protein
MSTTDNEIATKQKQVKPSDLRACGWLQTQFPESLWSGDISGPESGVDGHLWVRSGSVRSSLQPPESRYFSDILRRQI